MIRISFFIIAMILANIVVYAQKNSFDKLILENDTKLLQSYSESPSDFWKTVALANDDLNKFYKARSKETSIIQQIDNEYAEVLGQTLLLDKSVRENSTADMDTICIDLKFFIDGGDESLGLNNLGIIVSPEVNAFCHPFGGIYIYSGLMEILDNEEQILGTLSHEMAHHMLNHSREAEYRRLKKLAKDKVLSGIALAVTAAAEAVNAYTSSMAGIDYKPATTAKDYVLLANAPYAMSEIFKLKYSREHEYIADLNAYRFLEFMDINGEHYINVLRKLANSNQDYSIDASNSDHPSNVSRILMLKRVQELDNPDTCPYKYVIKNNEGKTVKINKASMDLLGLKRIVEMYPNGEIEMEGPGLGHKYFPISKIFFAVSEGYRPVIQ